MNTTAKNFKKFYDKIYPYLNGAAHAGFTPVGTVISLMGKTAPQNYLTCDGTVYNIADYPELAHYFAEQFESANFFGGDGNMTFAVPDLRGEFLRGTGTNSHENQGNGANVGVHQDGTELPRFVGDTSQYKGIIGFANSTSANPKNADSTFDQAEIAWELSNGNSWTDTNDKIMTSRPTNTSVLYCIAYKNIYIDARYDYSLEEKVVGTWIDGKPIYQKTISATTPSKEGWVGEWIYVGDLHIENLIDQRGFLVDSNDFQENIPITWPNYAAIAFGFTKLTGYIGVNTGNATGTGLLNTMAYITLRYTKTTD